MGLISTALISAASVAADQWKEYFYCDALPQDVLAVKGQRKTKGGNHFASDNVITTGSKVVVADGQCMLIVEQGKVVEACAEPGEYIFDSEAEPSIFTGGLNKESIMNVLDNVGKRFQHGGVAPTDQRVYYFNTKEIMNNKYGTPVPVPFRVVEPQIGLDMAVHMRCFGDFAYRITNPLLFYTNCCGNFSGTYTRSEIDEQLKSELLTQLQPAFGRISDMGIRYTSIAGHVGELAQILNDLLSAQWRDTRGIEITKFAISSITADPEDEKRIQDLQVRNAIGSNQATASGTIIDATAQAMQDAANNAAGAAVGLMGMQMAANAGGTAAAGALGMVGGQQAAPANGWTCECSTVNTGNFCSNCGKAKPAAGWTCECGTVNTGNFCSNCGKAKQ